jgi:hypothetical protein
MTTHRSRSQGCSAADARRRLQHAQQFLDVAEIAAEDQATDGSLTYGNAATTLAVLAGIAAADAACCKVLGRRSRADEHEDAVRLVEQIAGGGRVAAKDLRILIALKNDAQYGFHAVGTPDLTRSLRKARALVEFAERAIRP